MKYFSNRSQNCQWENFCVSSLDVCLATRSVSREAVTNSREVGYCLDRSGHTSTSWNKGPGHSLTMANVALIFEMPLSSVFNALDVSTGSRGDNSLSILVTAFPPPLIPVLSVAQPDTCLISVRRSTSKFSLELLMRPSSHERSFHL